jgi:hypothetical protein
MCTKLKTYFWKCGHRVQTGIEVCSPWAERSQILDANGKCPNDCISVEKCDGKCWDCTIEIDGPTYEEALDKLRSDLRSGAGGVRKQGV